MKIYFRIVHGHNGFYDWLVRFFTQSSDTHVEFCWPLTNSRPPYYLGAQPKGGVQVRDANYLRGSYTIYSVEIPSRRLLILQKFLTDQIGKKYDFLAILNLVFFRKELYGRNHWFCSYLVYFALAYIGVYLLSARKNASDLITPHDIALSPVATEVFHVGKYD